MIGGMMIILVSVWVYQSLMRAQKDNVMIWVAVCAALFFGVQFLLVDVNIAVMEAFKADPEGYERELTSVGDRKNEGGFQGFGGVLLSVYLELMPSIVGFLTAALIRIKFITHEAITVGNLFGGLKEMFQSIKQSFKTSSDN